MMNVAARVIPARVVPSIIRRRALAGHAGVAVDMLVDRAPGMQASKLRVSLSIVSPKQLSSSVSISHLPTCRNQSQNSVAPCRKFRGKLG